MRCFPLSRDVKPLLEECERLEHGYKVVQTGFTAALESSNRATRSLKRVIELIREYRTEIDNVDVNLEIARIEEECFGNPKGGG